MEDVRYIENPFSKIFNIVNPDKTQLYNLLLKLLSQFFASVKVPTVICQTSDPAKSEEDPTTYTGTGGYLYMFLKVFDFFSKKENRSSEIVLSKSKMFGDASLNQLTDPNFYLQMANAQYAALQNYILGRKRVKDCYSFFFSEVSTWLCGMHLGFKTRNVHLFRKNEQRVLQCFQSLKKNIQKQYWQLLYGVPGFLYAILQLQKSYEKAQQVFKTNFSPIAIELTHMIINQGIKSYEKLSGSKLNIQQLPADFRLVYFFHKTQYLGGAHGLGGNLSILLSSLKYNDFGGQSMRIMHLIKASISFLLKNLINGNFTTRAAKNDVKLVHFCHGAPGIVTALAKFTQIFPQIGITMGLKEVIELSLNHIWKFGVLKKGFGLCHGISGNAFAFISPALQQVFLEKTAQYLKKAQFFALLHEQEGVLKEIGKFNFKDRMVVGKSDEPFSLMVGLAGDICLAMAVITGSGYFPGYDI